MNALEAGSDGVMWTPVWARTKAPVTCPEIAAPAQEVWTGSSPEWPMVLPSVANTPDRIPESPFVSESGDFVRTPAVSRAGQKNEIPTPCRAERPHREVRDFGFDGWKQDGLTEKRNIEDKGSGASTKSSSFNTCPAEARSFAQSGATSQERLGAPGHIRKAFDHLPDFSDKNFAEWSSIVDDELQSVYESYDESAREFINKIFYTRTLAYVKEIAREAALAKLDDVYSHLQDEIDDAEAARARDFAPCSSDVEGEIQEASDEDED